MSLVARERAFSKFVGPLSGEKSVGPFGRIDSEIFFLSFLSGGILGKFSEIFGNSLTLSDSKSQGNQIFRKIHRIVVLNLLGKYPT